MPEGKGPIVFQTVYFKNCFKHRPIVKIRKLNEARSDKTTSNVFLYFFADSCLVKLIGCWPTDSCMFPEMQYALHIIRSMCKGI